MEVCWQQRPPFYRPDSTVAACFLYQDSPTLDSTDVAEVAFRYRRCGCWRLRRAAQVEVHGKDTSHEAAR